MSLTEDMFENLIPIVAIVFGCLCGIAVTVANNWRKVRQTETNAALKAELVKRGMSADEIERVLRAGESPPEKCG